MPLPALFLGVYREQGVGVVAFRCLMQWRGICALQIRRGRDDLLIQIRQRQAQWQAPVLGSPTQRRRAGLAVAHQARTLGGIIQPPAEDRRPIGPPHGQAGAAQGLLGGTRIEIDLQDFRGPGLKAVLADDLLRVFANRCQPRTLSGFGVAGQAQYQCVQRTLSRLVALLGRLAIHRLAHQVKAFDGFGLTDQADH
ncbi:hypothetical protein D3C72_1366580 [compost metagenome]